MRLENTFDVSNVGTKVVNLKKYQPCVEYRPVKFFIKEDGAVNGPSFAILAKHPVLGYVIMQVSASMFGIAFEKIKHLYEDAANEES